MTTTPQRPDDLDDRDDDTTVSEPETNPTPPDTEATTSEDVDDSPQLPTRRDVAT